ncbi:MAG: hypothetical protein ACP5NC_08030 [Nitrososphaeria archaeon]
MIDAYYRNGQLFLAKTWAEANERPLNEYNAGIIDGNFIKNNYTGPLKEFAGSSNISVSSADYSHDTGIILRQNRGLMF